LIFKYFEGVINTFSFIILVLKKFHNPEISVATDIEVIEMKFPKQALKMSPMGEISWQCRGVNTLQEMGILCAY
jgi:hypothetical protein